MSPEFADSALPDSRTIAPLTPVLTELADATVTWPDDGPREAPLMIVTAPPVAVTSVVDPACRVMLPPAPVSPVPSRTLMEPPRPPVAVPVKTFTEPELPLKVVPLNSEIVPETPETAELAEETMTLPLDVANDRPEVTVTEPPVA